MAAFVLPQQLVIIALEKALNQALALNSNANNGLAALDNKTLSVYLDELAFTLCFTVCQQHIMVTSNSEHSHCHIQTSLKTLWQLKQQQEQLTQLIKQGSLDLTGNIKVAQQFASLVDNLDIDWPNQLAKHIGDVPTYKLTQLGDLLNTKLAFAKQQISADASEWLIHEQKLVVSTHELAHFKQAVTNVNEEVNQFAQRLDALSNLVSQTIAK